MVLKDGGPCIALKKDKETGNMVTCGKVQHHLWYAGPTCKGCYEAASRKKQKVEPFGMATGVAIDPEVMQEESQETLVEIEEIYGSRCARAQTTHNPAPAQPVPPLGSYTPVSRLIPLRRLSRIPRERRERRNALEPEEKQLEYDVYGKFEFERENGKMAKAEWGRRWCTVGECSAVEDWVDSLKTFEMELQAARKEAEESYG